LGATDYETPEELLSACKVVHANLLAEDKFNRIFNRLPPMVEISKDEEKTDKNTESQTSPMLNPNKDDSPMLNPLG